MVSLCLSQGLQNFGLCSILNTYLHGLEKEGVEWGPELRELRFQAAWRNTQWDCDLPERCGFVFTLFNHYYALVEVCIRVMVETCQSVEILLYVLYCGVYIVYSATKINVQSWPIISAPLVNMIKEGCEN